MAHKPISREHMIPPPIGGGWALSAPGEPAKTTGLFRREKDGERRGPLPGRSVFSPENAPPKREIAHRQRHHDRHEPLHGKVRSGRHPAAALKSEYERKARATYERAGEGA